MNPPEQEQLFAQVRKRFPVWRVDQASGYVHGVSDGLRDDTTPDSQMILDNHRAIGNYAAGYIVGFIDAYGPDACQWFPGRSFDESHYRWWERNETPSTSSD